MLRLLAVLAMLLTWVLRDGKPGDCRTASCAVFCFRSCHAPHGVSLIWT